MKHLMIVLLLALVPQLSFAGGSLSLEPYYNHHTNKNGMKGGISMYQHLFKSPVFVTGYAGMGTDAEMGFSSTEQWKSAKVGVGIQPLNRLQVEMGEQWNTNADYSFKENITYMKASLQLW